MISNKQSVGYPCLIVCHLTYLFFTIGSLYLRSFNINMIVLISSAAFGAVCSIFLLLKNRQQISLSDWKYLVPTNCIMILMQINMGATIFCENSIGMFPFLRILPGSAVCYSYFKTILHILEMKCPKSMENIKQILCVACQNFTQVMIFAWFACLFQGLLYGGIYWVVWLGLTGALVIIGTVYWMKKEENYGEMKSFFNIQ